MNRFSALMLAATWSAMFVAYNTINPAWPLSSVAASSLRSLVLHATLHVPRDGPDPGTHRGAHAQTDPRKVRRQGPDREPFPRAVPRRLLVLVGDLHLAVGSVLEDRGVEARARRRRRSTRPSRPRSRPRRPRRCRTTLRGRSACPSRHPTLLCSCCASFRPHLRVHTIARCRPMNEGCRGPALRDLLRWRDRSGKVCTRSPWLGATRRPSAESHPTGTLARGFRSAQPPFHRLTRLRDRRKQRPGRTP